MSKPHDIAPADALDHTDVLEAEVGGTKIVLTRDGERVSAVAGTCPHAGGPLAQGIFHNGRLICPWHKAAFCARTGALLEPPAVDPLAQFDAWVENGRILVAPREPAPQVPAEADARVFAIIGGGAAGAMAAQTLREAGFAGRIVMFDRENRVPYDRTVLSKYFLSGEKGGEKTPLQRQSFYRERNIERRTETVTRLDTEQREISCASGFTLAFDAAFVAPGSTPKAPEIPGAELANIFVLRSRDDADAILAQAERSTRVVILGASFIGMEVAASLRERGLDVTVVAPEKIPFEKQLGGEVGGALRHLHEAHGVQFRLELTITSFEGGQAVEAVLLDSGEYIAADLVVIGLGVQPAAHFLDGAGDDGSMNVDAHLRAAGAVFAGGDVACFPLLGDGPLVRVEHWRVAEQHGRVAALNMLGGQVVFDKVPVFWTIQYMKRVDYIGHAKAWDSVVVHGDLRKPEFLVYYVKDGRVVAATGMDRDADMAALIELFEARRDWTAEALGARPGDVLKQGVLF